MQLRKNWKSGKTIGFPLDKNLDATQKELKGKKSKSYQCVASCRCNSERIERWNTKEHRVGDVEWVRMQLRKNWKSVFLCLNLSIHINTTLWCNSERIESQAVRYVATPSATARCNSERIESMATTSRTSSSLSLMQLRKNWKLGKKIGRGGVTNIGLWCNSERIER